MNSPSSAPIPSALLWDGDQATAFVSVWQVDWSIEGSGGALVLCRPGELRVLCDPPLLGRWLFDNFVTHFRELAHFDFPARPTVEKAAVRIDLDLTAGLHASAGDVSVRITGILDRRRTLDSGLRLGGSLVAVAGLHALPVGPDRSRRRRRARRAPHPRRPARSAPAPSWPWPRPTPASERGQRGHPGRRYRARSP